jgi:hypothetical protein
MFAAQVLPRPFIYLTRSRPLVLVPAQLLCFRFPDTAIPRTRHHFLLHPASRHAPQLINLTYTGSSVAFILNFPRCGPTGWPKRAVQFYFWQALCCIP